MNEMEEVSQLRLQLEQERSRRIAALESEVKTLKEVFDSYIHKATTDRTMEGETLSKLRLMMSDCQSQVKSIQEQFMKDSFANKESLHKNEQTIEAVGAKMDLIRETIVVQQQHISTQQQAEASTKEKFKVLQQEIKHLNHATPLQDQQINQMGEKLEDIKRSIAASSVRLTTIEEQMPLLNFFKDRLNLVSRSIITFVVTGLLGLLVWAIKSGADIF